MDKINEDPGVDLIDLGAASIETKGGQQTFGEPDGRNRALGLSED